ARHPQHRGDEQGGPERDQRDAAAVDRFGRDPRRLRQVGAALQRDFREPVALNEVLGRMKIVVTGGLGKAGRWIVRELTSAEGGRQIHEVAVFDQAPGTAADGIQCIAGNVRDLAQVRGALAGSDAVIHLAGVPRNGMVSDEETFQTNVMGTFNVHEAAWRLGIRRVVTLGSEAVLGWAPHAPPRNVAPDYLPIDEDHPLRPHDPYGLSKQAAELIARSYTEKA